MAMNVSCLVVVSQASESPRLFSPARGVVLFMHAMLV